MTTSTPGRLEFYSDSGWGFNEAERFERAYVQRTVDKDFFVNFPRPVRALRFDPLDAPGRVFLESLLVEFVPVPWTWWHALRAHFRRLGGFQPIARAFVRTLHLLVRGRFTEIYALTHGALHRPDLGATGFYDEDAAYQAWRQQHQVTEAERQRMAADSAAMTNPPRISLLLDSSDANLADLRRTIESVRRQTYSNWELLPWFAQEEPPDTRALLTKYGEMESRIRLTGQHATRGRSTTLQQILGLLRGEYVGLVDSGDELAEHALVRMANAINADRTLDMIYSDEDRIGKDGRHYQPFFKPDWSPEYEEASGYTGRLALIRSQIVLSAGWFGNDDQSITDLNFKLKLVDGRTHVGHIPDILYHRKAAMRVAQSSTSQGACSMLLGRPSVCIIIPSSCEPVFLDGKTSFCIVHCLASIRQKTSYPNYEILLVHHQELPADLDRQLSQHSVRRLCVPGPFNWSASMNRAAGTSCADHFLFLNDDTEIITPDWLESLLEFSQRAEIGAVGAKLLFPDGRLQHAGVTLLDCRPKHCFYSYPGTHAGYHGHLMVPRNVSAVTGACLMTRAEVFRAAGGFDEDFPLDFNDIDYCLRVQALGWRIVCTPHARLYHRESATKGETATGQAGLFRRRWHETYSRDPYYNPNLSVHHDDYRIDAGGT
jgi:GT2 family glycosyltransferase